MHYESLFMDSFALHQQLVNLFKDSRNAEGVSVISQPELAKRIGRSQTWVASAIKRLNTEDTCVELISAGKYKLHYDDLLSRGVFSVIVLLIADTQITPSLFKEQADKIAEEYGCSIKTVQMYKAYLSTGRRVSTRKRRQEE